MQHQHMKIRMSKALQVKFKHFKKWIYQRLDQFDCYISS